MGLEFKRVRSTLVVRVSGEMDMLIADKMRAEIDKRIDDKNIKNLVLNLEKVTFMDSSGLGLIIGRYKRISAKQGRMFIVGARPQVEKILFFSGVNRLVPLYKNEQEVINI
ncbi:MAG: anti-sigma F factor antagonist [Syntrophomonadaceae bacterium]|jgi:stage II sporulation protein AA (anti-sigma F factor antagonist)|nr:anti-sigma F factor antagonist [Syntrophomonadaceae bacterium]